MTGGRHSGRRSAREGLRACAACGVGLRVRLAWRPVRFGLGSLFAMPEVCGSAELRFAHRRFVPGAGSPGGRVRWARRAASQALCAPGAFGARGSRQAFRWFCEGSWKR